MSRQFSHPRSITLAARETLRPLGMVQKGRSRSWLDDQGWWLGHVEFQPSSWSRGSYVNIGVMWLWEPASQPGWHEVFRLRWADAAGFRTQSVRFESEEQFAPAARRMVAAAADQILIYRSLFATIDECADQFLHTPEPPWSSLMNGAIALDLVGRPDDAEAWCDAVIATERDVDWVMAKQLRAANLKSQVRDRAAFQDLIMRTIRAR